MVRPIVAHRIVGMAARRQGLSVAAFRGAPVALAMIDVEGRLTAVNDAFLRLWGLPDAGAVLGRSVIDLGPVPDRIGQVRAALETDGRWSGEIRANRPDGTLLMVGVEAVRIGEDAVASVLAAFSDVTELHMVEDALKTLAKTTAPFSREGFLSALVGSVSRVLGSRWAFVGETAAASPPRVSAVAACEQGRPMPPFDYALDGTPCAGVVGRSPCVFTSAVRDAFPDDAFFAEHDVEAYIGFPLFASDGRPMGILVAMHDSPLQVSSAQHALISVFASRAAAELERLRDEQHLLATTEELRRNSELLSRAQDSAHLGGWEYRHGRQQFFWTNGLHRVFGTDASHSETTPEAFLAFIAQSGRERVFRRLREPETDGDSWSEEVEARKATGETIWLRLTGRAVRRADGRTRTFGSAQDITEARWFQLERRRLFDLSADMMCIAGNDGYFQLVNPAFEATLGWTTDELLAKPFLEFVHPDDVEKTTDVYRHILSGAPITEFENRWRRKDGSWCWMEWRSTAILEGGILYAIARDVTRRKSLEEQVRHSQKLEAVGRLAGGIAHDFNNLLTAILGGVELIARDVAADLPSRRHLASIRTSAERAKGLTRQLLTFARRQVTVPERVDVGALISGMGNMLETALGEDIVFRVDAPDGLWPIRIDPGQLEQVILNLAVNSRDAMPRGGSLTITLENTKATPASPAWPGGPGSGDWVRLRITDTGVGMDPDIQKHVFEPFFSTKSSGRGTGLGLATCHGILEQNRGHITFRSRPGTGTTFTVLLPRDGSPPSTPTDEKVLDRVGGGGETVLLVEDEPAVRELAKEILSGSGYRVLVAADGDDALRVAREHAERIDLLFTDVVLPRRNGWDVAEILIRERPEIRLLFSSGYAEDAMERLGVPKPMAFLPKPYTPEMLLARIRAVLDEGP